MTRLQWWAIPPEFTHSIRYVTLELARVLGDLGDRHSPNSNLTLVP